MADDRTSFDLDEKKDKEMSDEKKFVFFRNTDEMMMDIMFPDGLDNE